MITKKVITELEIKIIHSKSKEYADWYVHDSAQWVLIEWKETPEMFKYLGLLLRQKQFTPLHQFMTQNSTVKGQDDTRNSPNNQSCTRSNQTTHKLRSATTQMLPHNLHLSIMGK